MPLIVAGAAEQPARDPEHEEARKIQPRYARGDLQRVAVGSNLAEGELIKGVLLEQGIPSMLRRTSGFDVPDFLAAGPRDVLVPESGAAAARELLAEVEGESAVDAGGADVTFGRSYVVRALALALAVLLVFGAIAGVVWVVAP